MRHFKKDTKTRVLAAVLCLCMVLTMFSGVRLFTLTSSAASAAGGATENIVPNSRVADPNTMDDYVNRLLTETSGSRYAGRVWTDKTVFAYGEGSNTITLDMATDGYNGDVLFNADFAHVFSALASSQVVNEYPPSPIDMVLVLDISSSMGDETEAAEGTPWADIYSALEGYFQTPEGQAQIVTFSASRKANHYLQFEFVTEDQDDDASIRTKAFTRAEFPNENAFSDESYQLDEDGKMHDEATVRWFLEKYKVGGYIQRIGNQSGNNWEYVEEPTEQYECRKITAVRISHDSDFWIDDGTTYGKEISVEEAAARKAFVHTRFLNLIYSANRVIEQLMANNPENRVSVVVYDRRATVVMPLAHYTANQKKLSKIEAPEGFYGNYILGTNDHLDGATNTIFNVLSDLTFGYLCPFFDAHGSNRSHPTNYVNVSSARIVATTREGEVAADGSEITTKGFGSDGNGLLRIAGTNTHAGLTAGLEQLANAMDTTLTAKLSNEQMSTVPRIPAAIVMTDGGSNTVANGPWYDPDYGTPVQRSDHKNDWSSIVVTQYLMTAAYLKSAVENNYSAYMALGDKQDLPVYTVGVDLRDDSDNWVPARLYPMMDPTDYFVDGEVLPGTTVHPGGADIALGSDSTNKILIDNAYDNWMSWSAGPTQQVTDEFHVAEAAAEGLFQQNEDSSTHTYDPYIIPFEQDDVNVSASERSLQSWSGDLGGIRYDNLYYNTLWHGWTNDPVTDPTHAAVSFPSVSSVSSLTGTATFWSFNEALATAAEGKAYQPAGADGPSYQADYLAERSIQNNDAPADEATHLNTRTVQAVTQADMVSNINYVTRFYDVSSAEMDSIFEQILAEVMGQVFVPISGDNDAGVGDSITYQDPIGEYMEVKSGSITATPHHVQGHGVTETPTTYDMALLLFGEMHGLVRTGIYDFKWNDAWMQAHEGQEIDGERITPGVTPFPMGWYLGDERVAGANALPKDCSSTDEAWEKGYVFRLNNSSLIAYVPIVEDTDSPGNLSEQAKNTVYTIYRFAGDAKDRNMLRRNPIYGEVPDDIEQRWEEASAGGTYPESNEIYANTPGVYRLSDIRVWVEDTGDFVDTDGAFTPNTGYDRSLYVNIPAAAIPTELATVTLGRDGVMSYETNLGRDHLGGTDMGTPDEITYNEYCYQSTPFRLFYAVGLEDDLILRDASGSQIGVDLNSISPEYIQAHTDADTGNVWFISNYYSSTRYGEYTTEDATYSRGDPTVTFSPGIDNRYYVFQKPLPLYAHAYRVSADGNGVSVDNTNGAVWAPNTGGNSSTVWEDGSTGGASWQGGQFMGVYTDRDAFYEAYRNRKDGKITDSHGSVYDFVDDGIIFSEEDVLDHVTSTADGGYEAGSMPFSSDDYYFILLEFYVPEKGTPGTDRSGNEIDGATGGKFVQWALARKGSEFGSGYASDEIGNGDMLCWTDMNGLIDTNFAYMSKQETGDLTRGEPTWEKLTKTGGDLENYLYNDCKIKRDTMVPNPDYNAADPTGGAETITVPEYWEKMQAKYAAVLDAAKKIPTLQ